MALAKIRQPLERQPVIPPVRLSSASAASFTSWAARNIPRLACEGLFKVLRGRGPALLISVNALTARGLGGERLGPLINRQSAIKGQALVELAINAIEAVRGKKIIGRYGEGRLQSLKGIVAVEGAEMIVRTMARGETIGREIKLAGQANRENDVAVSLRELKAGEITEAGTEVQVKRKMEDREIEEFKAAVSRRLKYVSDIEIALNGEVINPEKLRIGGAASDGPVGRVEIEVSESGYRVKDQGTGMDAETLIKRYLAIGNSEGEHERKYDDNEQRVDLYFEKEETPAKNGKVSFLLCGVEVEGVEVEGMGIEGGIGIEMGSGLKRNEGTDRVLIGNAEGQRIMEIVKEVMQIKNERKYRILNTILAALDKLSFDNGLKEELMGEIYRLVGPEIRRAEEKEPVIFVPNREGFDQLKVAGGRRKVYLNERLFSFNNEAAGIVEYEGYEGNQGYRLYVGEFENGTVTLETGKEIIVNAKYAGNKLMLNLLFNFWVGYGPRAKGKIRIKMPWDKAKLPETEEAPEKAGVALAVITDRQIEMLSRTYLKEVKGTKKENDEAAKKMETAIKLLSAIHLGESRDMHRDREYCWNYIDDVVGFMKVRQVFDELWVKVRDEVQPILLERKQARERRERDWLLGAIGRAAEGEPEKIWNAVIQKARAASDQTGIEIEVSDIFGAVTEGVGRQRIDSLSARVVDDAHTLVRMGTSLGDRHFLIRKETGGGIRIIDLRLPPKSCLVLMTGIGNLVLSEAGMNKDTDVIVRELEEDGMVECGAMSNGGAVREGDAIYIAGADGGDRFCVMRIEGRQRQYIYSGAGSGPEIHRAGPNILISWFYKGKHNVAEICRNGLRQIAGDYETGLQIFDSNGRIFIAGKKGACYSVDEIIEGQAANIAKMQKNVENITVAGDRIILSSLGDVAEAVGGEAKWLTNDGDHVLNVFADGNRIFMIRRKNVFNKGPECVLEEIIGDQVKEIASYDNILGSLTHDSHVIEGRLLLSVDKGKEHMVVELVGDEMREISGGYNNCPFIKKVGKRIFIDGARGYGPVIEELTREGIREIARNNRWHLDDMHEAGERAFCSRRKFGSGIVRIFEIVEGKLAELPNHYDSITSVYQSGSRILIRGLKKGLPVVDEIVGDKVRGLVYAGEEEMGYRDNGIEYGDISKAIPDLSSLKPAPFTEPATEQRRKTALIRIIRGDYLEGYDLRLWGYVGRKVCEALGEEMSRKIESKLNSLKGQRRELYFKFIEKLWADNTVRLADEELRLAIERWGQIFEVLEENMEIERLLDYFEKNDLYCHFTTDPAAGRDTELQNWIEFFKEENLDGKIRKERAAEPVPDKLGAHAIQTEHDLSFYAWVNRRIKNFPKTGLADFRGLVEEFNRLAIEPMRRRLIGVILGQSSESDISIREIAQNSRDAGSRALEITSFIREGEQGAEQVAVFRDEGRGMSAEEVKGMLLNIESDNKEKTGKRMIGKNGIGFKSVFKDADRVKITTTRGDGAAVEVAVRCERGAEGQLKGVIVESFRQRREKGASGTRIEISRKIKGSGSELNIRAVLMELFFKRRIEKYVGLVRDMEIVHNGERVNTPIIKEESLEAAGRGRYALLETKGRETRQVQAGLWINDEMREMKTQLPVILRDYIEGSAFEIGEKEELTRGRGQAMEGMRERGKLLAVLAMRKAVRGRIYDGLNIPGIPQDFLYSQHVELGNGNLEGCISHEIREDAQRINEGRFLEVEYDRYRERQDELIMLLSLLEIESGGGKKLSLMRCREIVIEVMERMMQGEDPLEALKEIASDKLRNEIIHAAETRWGMLKAHESEREREIKAQKTLGQETDEFLLTEFESIYRDYVKSILDILGKGEYEVGFYSGPGESRLADFSPGQIIFRREAFDQQLGLRMLSQIIEGKTNEDLHAWLYGQVETIAHELVHLFYLGDEGWSHGADPRIDRSFARHMKAIIEEIIQAGFDGYISSSGSIRTR